MNTTVGIEEGNRLIAEFMGFPKVTEFSYWDYDRSLDNASIVRNLCVKSVQDGMVTFIEKMPFEKYGIEYFDGRVFSPRGLQSTDHAPCRPYITDLNWLGPVECKIYETGERDMMDSLTRKLDWWETDKTYAACVKFIQWYNKQSSKT